MTVAQRPTHRLRRQYHAYGLCFGAPSAPWSVRVPHAPELLSSASVTGHFLFDGVVGTAAAIAVHTAVPILSKLLSLRHSD